VRFNDSVIITPHYKRLQKLLEGSTTLEALGWTAKTGSIVWNEHKDKLSATQKDPTYFPVIYPNNIVNNDIVLDNLKDGKAAEKKQYISGINKPTVKGPAFIVNRGHGNVYKFEWTVVGPDMEFYGENHVNVIVPTTDIEYTNIMRIFDSFSCENTREFIELFVGNGAMSATELRTMMPIF
jgi:hypothetical protein